MFFNDFPQTGLCETRFVALIVTVFAVAHHVDKHVGIETLAVFGGQFAGEHNGFGVVAIDVENGSLHHFRNRGTIGGRASVGPVGGKSDLVVDDQMYGSAGIVPCQAHHLDHFVHDALSGHCGIAVDQDREHPVVDAAVHRIQFGAAESFHHRIDSFEVAGIGQQFDIERFPVQGLGLGRITLVVFHVAGTETLIRDGFIFKGIENLVVGFADNIT